MNIESLASRENCSGKKSARKVDRLKERQAKQTGRWFRAQAHLPLPSSLPPSTAELSIIFSSSPLTPSDSASLDLPTGSLSFRLKSVVKQRVFSLQASTPTFALLVPPTSIYPRHRRTRCLPNHLSRSLLIPKKSFNSSRTRWMPFDETGNRRENVLQRLSRSNHPSSSSPQSTSRDKPLWTQSR